MDISTRGIALIKQFEALRLTAYRDSADVLTIGWGHTGPDVKQGDRITEKQAEALLSADVGHAAATLRDAVRPPLRQEEFDALTSLIFNIGAANFKGSTLLKILNKSTTLLSSEQRMEASLEFPKWRFSKKKALPGLLRRRFAEAALFLSN